MHGIKLNAGGTASGSRYNVPIEGDNLFEHTILAERAGGGHRVPSRDPKELLSHTGHLL